MDAAEMNRLSWNAATVAHNSHKGDQAQFFRNGGSTLYPEELALLGEIDGSLRFEPGHRVCSGGVRAAWAQLEVQVRPGGVARRSDGGDLLAGGHPITGSDHDAGLGHVRVPGGHRLPGDGVLDQDQVPVPCRRAGGSDPAVGCSEDRRSGWGSEVDAGVQFVDAGDRVETHPVVAGLDPGAGWQGEHNP